MLALLLAEAEHPVERHYGNVLFLLICILVVIVAVLWWMKRNYM